MQNIRVIARLDIKGPNLIKGIHLEGLRVLGEPHDFAKKYYEEGIDEIVYIFLSAVFHVERKGRNTKFYLYFHLNHVLLVLLRMKLFLLVS